MGMDVWSAVTTWRFFSPASSHTVAQSVPYVSMWMIEGTISLSSAFCKPRIIVFRASVSYWVFMDMVRLANGDLFSGSGSSRNII